jgi:endonuclease III
MPQKKRATGPLQTTSLPAGEVLAKNPAKPAKLTTSKAPVKAVSTALTGTTSATKTGAAKAPKKTATANPATQKRGAAPHLSAAAITEMFRRFHAHEPEPKGELEYVNPFTLLVAVVLSAQATDVGVNRATRPLFEVARTPAAMVALGEDAVREYIKTIGLFRNKAKNVIALSEQLIANHGGEVPTDLDALVALPGVGRKTASVVLNMAFGLPTMAVDTHVFRVANRTGMAPGKDVIVVEQALLAVVPAEYALHAHHWLILHGRYTCLARKPLCATCRVADLCLWDEKTA